MNCSQGAGQNFLGCSGFRGDGPIKNAAVEVKF